jgi:hypothetical protein
MKPAICQRRTMKIILAVALVVLAADAPPPIEAPRAPRDAPHIVTCSIANYCLWSNGEWRSTTQSRPRR